MKTDTEKVARTGQTPTLQPILAGPARAADNADMTELPAASAVIPSLSADVAAFFLRLQQSLTNDRFVRLALGRPLDAADPSLEKLLVRRVLLRGQAQLSLVWRHRTKDITKNLPEADGLALLAPLMASQFGHAHLITHDHDIQLALGKKGQWALRVGKLAAPAAQAHTAEPDAASAHDRPKQHALSLALPFLAELGVTDAQGRLVPAMARKWRQINKFAEVLAHAIASSPLAPRDPAQPVRVLDFGAGKGYLTFAVQHLLQASGRVPDVTGVELRSDLTTLCNRAVAQLGLAGLHFEAGDIRDFATQAGPEGDGGTGTALDIMIALHACDTATDVAMHEGVRRGAAIILCSPCCHKQLRPQLTAPPLLAPMLRHGIHMTEQAEMLTDTLRAVLLQAEGYDTQVFEFISPEHTGKNKMVLAVKRAQPLPAAQRSALRAQATALKAYYGVTEHCLETLLDADAAGPARQPVRHETDANPQATAHLTTGL